MATRKISIGRSYSEAELNKLGIYQTPYLMETVTDIRSPLTSLDSRGIPVNEYKDSELSVGGSVFRFGDDEVSFSKINIENYLKIYANGTRMFLIDENNTVHFFYKKDSSVIMDECVDSCLNNEMARRGFDEFHLESGISDKKVMDELYKMNVLGILTHDTKFGKDNKLKKGKYISEREMKRLYREYEKIKPFADENVVVCDRNDSPHHIFQKFMKKKKDFAGKKFDYFLNLEEYMNSTF